MKIKREQNRSEEFQDSELTYRIIGCAQRVHRTLGPGFPESVYQKSLCLELLREKIPFESEKIFEVSYEGISVGKFRADFLVDEKVVVELKALEKLDGNHLAQAISYLKASGLNLALLLNFGRKSLETKRVVL
ncbi:MAG: GxxExxY protein [Planctomycetota bacterium]|jgi:GxxExxY protein